MIDDDAGSNQSTTRAATRRRALGGALRLLRTHRVWSVRQAAAAADVAPMTWRRLEEGLAVRERTHTALDQLLRQPPGATARALADDVLMVELVASLGVVLADDVAPEDAGAFLVAFTDRLSHGSTQPPASAARTDGLTELELATRLVERLRTGPAPTQPIDRLVHAALRAMPDLFGRDQPGRSHGATGHGHSDRA